MAATAAVVGLTLLLAGRRAGHTDPAIVAGGSVLAYTLLGAYVLPWYVFWGVPALVLAWRSRLTWLALAHGAILHIAYVPDPALQRARADPLYILTPLQRLQLDLYQVWVPLIEAAVIAAVVVVSLRRPRSAAPSET
jgi:hypothetical protein